MTIAAGTYVLDNAHSTVGFTARHAMVTKVRGTFTDFNAQATISEDNSVAVTATIQAASVTTGNADRDGHLSSPDFFDTANHPEITFVSTGSNIDLTAGAEGTITGTLTIKGVSQEVVLDVELSGTAEDPYGNTRLGFEASTTINRKDFGIDFNAPLSTGGVLISEKITITIDGSAIKQ